MPDPQQILAQRFTAAVTAAFGEQAGQADPLIAVSANPKFGDYQANLAMGLGKQLGMKPRDVAQKIVEKLDLSGIAEKVEIAGPGFINLHLGPPFLQAQAGAMAADARLGVPLAAPSECVVIDYAGPNVAKEMHAGHLRTCAIGDALGRVLEFQGHRVIRQDHLGDWGTQFGMLIQFLLETQGDAEHRSIGDLNVFYKEAKKKFDADADFAVRARQRVVALQSGDPETLRLWQILIDESKRHFQQVYQRLRLKLTPADIRPESFYNPMLPDLTAELEAKGIATLTQGALGVFLPGYKDKEGQPLPLLIRKSDGGYLYATTDLAGIRYRATVLHAQRMIYVTDARQRERFAMLFKTAELAGWTDGPQGHIRLEHVHFGTVLGEDGTPFKARSGDTVKLADLLDEAEQRAAAVIVQKNPDLAAQRAEVARVVGIGAIKYADLSNDRVKDYVFDWERMVSFDGNTAPYLQNAYVRIQSIFRKARTQGIPIPAPGTGQEISIADPAERMLVLKLLQFQGVVDSVGRSLEPHRLCTFLHELASGFHSFFEKCPVLAPDAVATRAGRLALRDLVARTLKQGLDLLGIEVVEQM